MELEGKIDALRALELEIFSTAPSLAECNSFLKLMMQPLRMPSHLLMEITGTAREMKGILPFIVYSAVTS